MAKKLSAFFWVVVFAGDYFLIEANIVVNAIAAVSIRRVVFVRRISRGSCSCVEIPATGPMNTITSLASSGNWSIILAFTNTRSESYDSFVLKVSSFWQRWGQ